MARESRTFFCGVLYLGLLASGGPAGAREPQPAMPLGDPGMWVTTPDYPPTALMDDLEGVVAFRLTIDSQGRVESCLVTQSSGTDALDTAACNLITQRARFSPAADGRGRPTVGTYSNRVRWVLPKERPQPQPATLEATFIVETDGSFSDCKIVTAEGVPVEATSAKAGPCERNYTTTPFLDESGRAVRKLVRSRMTIRIEPAP